MTLQIYDWHLRFRLRYISIKTILFRVSIMTLNYLLILIVKFIYHILDVISRWANKLWSNVLIKYPLPTPFPAKVKTMFTRRKICYFGILIATSVCWTMLRAEWWITPSVSLSACKSQEIYAHPRQAAVLARAREIRYRVPGEWEKVYRTSVKEEEQWLILQIVSARWEKHGLLEFSEGRRVLCQSS